MAENNSGGAQPNQPQFQLQAVVALRHCEGDKLAANGDPSQQDHRAELDPVGSLLPCQQADVWLRHCVTLSLVDPGP